MLHFDEFAKRAFCMFFECDFYSNAYFANASNVLEAVVIVPGIFFNSTPVQ